MGEFIWLLAMVFCIVLVVNLYEVVWRFALKRKNGQPVSIPNIIPLNFTVWGFLFFGASPRCAGVALFGVSAAFGGRRREAMYRLSTPPLPSLGQNPLLGKGY